MQWNDFSPPKESTNRGGKAEDKDVGKTPAASMCHSFSLTPDRPMKHVWQAYYYTQWCNNKHNTYCFLADGYMKSLSLPQMAEDTVYGTFFVFDLQPKTKVEMLHENISTSGLQTVK